MQPRPTIFRVSGETPVRGERNEHSSTKADAPAPRRVDGDAFSRHQRVHASQRLVAAGQAQTTLLLGSDALGQALGMLTHDALAQGVLCDALSKKLGDALDRTDDGTSVRLTHLVLRRLSLRTLIATTTRQRLVSSLGAALGRSKERLPVASSPGGDLLGLPRGENGFVDRAVQIRQKMAASAPDVAFLIRAVTDLKTEEGLRNAFIAGGKLVGARVLGKSDYLRLLSEMYRTQARLGAKVVPVAGPSHASALLPVTVAQAPEMLASEERALLISRLQTASPEAASKLRALLLTLAPAGLFTIPDHQAMLAALEQPRRDEGF